MKKKISVKIAKKGVRGALCCLLGSVLLLGAGCSAGRADRLAAAAVAEPVSYREISTEDYVAFRESAEGFASGFMEELFRGHEARMRGEKDNFVASPVSVYTALATAAACADGETKREILPVLNTTAEALDADFPVYYRSLGAVAKGEKTGYAQLANSIWIDDEYGTHVRDTGLRKLSEQYFCDVFSASFASENIEANRAVRAFVKEKTKGLIDRDFNLSDRTVFALVNTLYLKDVWALDGSELPLSESVPPFVNADGTQTQLPFMQTPYRPGRTARGDGFSFFRASTQHGYTLKVLLPDEGKTVEELFTAENLAFVNAEKGYGSVDEESGTHYYTRLLLPAFEANCDEDLIATLQNLGIHALFDPEACSYGVLLEDGAQAYCNKAQHVARLKVDRRGIEGAAVTVLRDVGTAIEPVPEVYEDFVVGRAFGFLLTDPYGNILFAGVVRSL